MNPEVEKAVADLEALIGVPLPADYRQFLLSYGGDALKGKRYWMPHPDGRWIEDIEQCYWVDFLLEDIVPSEIELRRKGIGTFAPGLLPIADDGCGDTVLLSYRDRDYGAVYHYFHEEGDADNHSAGLYLLAPTFSEWLQQIEACSEENPPTEEDEELSRILAERERKVEEQRQAILNPKKPWWKFW